MKKIALIKVIVIILVMATGVFGYETNVHREITIKAVTASGIASYLNRNLSVTLSDKIDSRTIQEWMEKGSQWEDKTFDNSEPAMRYLNHFYDPTTGLGLNDSGTEKGSPSLQWANLHSGNDYDWLSARYSYLYALTSEQHSVRESFFAELFRSLGQLMHLVHDKAVPAHVRNDAHFPYLNSKVQQRDMYEKYTGAYADPGDGILNYDGYDPVDIATFNSLDSFWINGGKGLSEFTNSNFVSRNTNFDDNKYALPGAIAEPGIYSEPVIDPEFGQINVSVKYALGYLTDQYRPVSSPAIRLAAYSYFDFEAQKLAAKHVFSLNDGVHKEYANILVPRAVGYSAGLLNYFFRGSIEITIPDSGIYALADASGTGFTTINLLAKNVTANSEAMTDGSVELVVQYKPTSTEAVRYTVFPEANGVRTLSAVTPVELTFDLTQNPIPFTATDLYVHVVYHGTLGTEAGAVAVGFKDLSEPTPIEVYNNMDWICLKGSWETAGSAAAETVVDTDAVIGNNNGTADEWDVYPHTMENVYIKLSSLANPQQASTTVYDHVYTNQPTGSLSRPLYILSDEWFNYSFYITRAATDGKDTWTHIPSEQLYEGTAIKHQTEYTTDPVLCNDNPPCDHTTVPDYYTFRGTDMWWGGGMIFVNKPYPTGTECVLEAL